MRLNYFSIKKLKSYFRLNRSGQYARQNDFTDASLTSHPNSSTVGIKFMTHFFPPDCAATGQFISEIAQSLSCEEIKVSVFTSQPSYAIGSYAGKAPRMESYNNLFIWRSRLVRIWSSRVRGKAIQGLLFCLRCFLFFLRPRNRQDLFVVTTAPPFLPILLWLVHKLFRVKYVCIIYDLYPDVANQLGVSHPQHPVSRFWRHMNQHAWKNAQALIVLNEAMRDRILDHFPPAFPKIHILHNWADHHRIKPIPKHLNTFAQSHDLAHPFVVLYSGNLGRCHDAETIFQALELLHEHPIQFVFIGGGANLDILKQQIRQSPLSLNAKFLPYQDWDEIPNSLAACDVSLVSIAKGFEGLVVPSKLYSSLAVGRPVAAICEAESYLIDLLENTNAGQTFRNGDAEGLANYLLQLSQSPEMVAAQGLNARQCLLENFTRELITADYKRVLLNVLHDEAPKPSPTIRQKSAIPS